MFELFVENRSGYERCAIALWHQGKQRNATLRPRAAPP